MELTFKTEAIIGMLLKCYAEEGKDIQININKGKVVNNEAYLPKTTVVHFEVTEEIETNHGVEKIKRILSKDEVIKMMTHVLLAADFVVTYINFAIDSKTGAPIAKVSGTKVDLKSKTI